MTILPEGTVPVPVEILESKLTTEQIGAVVILLSISYINSEEAEVAFAMRCSTLGPVIAELQDMGVITSKAVGGKMQIEINLDAAMSEA